MPQGGLRVATRRDDDYLRLKQSVDEWVSEVTEARSALSQSLKVKVTRRPAFRLQSTHAPKPKRPPNPLPATVSSRSSDDARAFRDALTRHANAADHQRRETDRDRSILERDLDFAREQLHVQNRLREEAEEKHNFAEKQYDETVHLLGRAQISVDELRRQLRGKEWALEKAMAALDSRSVTMKVDSQATEELAARQREAAALHSRLETLTAELQQARERAEHEREAAAMAKARLEKLDVEAERSRHIVDELSKQVQQYAESLRETGRELDAARAALKQSGAMTDSAPARAGLTDEQSEILRLRLAERGAADIAQAAKAAERVAIDQLSESVAEAAVLLDNYDALAESHMALRDEVTELQQRIIERDHELAALKAELATSQMVAPAPFADGPDEDLGQEWLVSALRAELAAERDSREQSEMEHNLLRQALTQEIEGLRGLATERDLVIHHQTVQLDAVLETAGRDAGDSARREATVREIQLLRSRIDEKDATVRRLRGELADAEERASVQSADDVSELEAALRTREDDLSRTRERVEYLRRVLSQMNIESSTMTKQLETRHSALAQKSPKYQPMKHHETADARAVSGAGDIDVSRYQANAALQREVEQSLAFHSMWPIVAAVGVIAGMGFLGLAVLLFLVA